MKPTNLNYLFADQVVNFAHLLKCTPLKKQEFAEIVRGTYDISNPKTALFYQAILKSEFETIRLNNTRDTILLNH
jgi:hypothetical protein